MLLLLFIGIPLLEIYLFIQVGSAIGAGLTIFLIVFTAIVGVVMLKAQSLATLARFRQSLNRDGMVGYELFEGTFLIIGGALLLTPGFFTDIVGVFMFGTTQSVMAYPHNHQKAVLRFHRVIIIIVFIVIFH